MYKTSQKYKEKILNNSTQHELNIYIDDKKIEPNHIIDFKTTLELFNNNEFCLGCTPEIDIEFEIDKRDLPEVYNEVYVETGIDEEVVPIGYFTIQKPIEDDEFKVKIKATDYMKKFEDNKYDGSDLTYPATMLQTLQDICTKIGVELGSTSFLNDDKQIAVYDNTVTARTYISYIAEQAGGFAVMGRDGKLYIKTFGEDTANIDINLFGDFKWGDKYKVSRVSYEDGIQNYKFGDETASTVYINQNNIYIVDSEQIENIYNQIKDFEVYTFKGETIIDPAYDIGDILVIDGKKVLFQGELEYAGKFKANIKSKIQAKTEQESMQTKSSNSTKIRKIQSEINQIDGKIAQLVQEQTENSSKISQHEQDIDSITNKISETNNELEQKTSKLKQTIDGLNHNLTQSGGNNIFYYAKEFWTDETEDSQANLEEYTDTEIQQNSVSGNGYKIKSGISKQVAQVKNNSYTISFTYKKLNSLATGYVLINGTQYDLDNEDWKEQVITLDINTNAIDFRIYSDTDDAFVIFDLMCNAGTEKQIWTQNPNETRTDSVQIGKGIQVNSSSTNTYTRIDADGNRTFNSATGEVVMEATDKGVKSKEVITNLAQIGGILVQEIDGQTWISGLL